MEALIPYITAIVGIFVGYFLNQALYEKKRRDELEDRDYKRRAEIHDRRIQEARDYLDVWEEAIASFEETEKLLTSGDPQFVELMLDNRHQKLDSLMEDNERKGGSILILGDIELIRLELEFSSIIQPELINCLLAMETLVTGKTIRDNENEWGRISDVFSRASHIMRKMKIRLDELAKKVP